MTKYTLNVMGMKIKGQTAWIYAFFPIFVCIAYKRWRLNGRKYDTMERCNEI